MFNQPFLFLLLLLGIGLFAKNQSLVIAAAVLIILKMIGADVKNLSRPCKQKELIGVLQLSQLLFWLQSQVDNIGFKELGGAVKSPYAWIALAAGMAVAIIAKYGLTLLAEDPHITASLVIGTILAVALLKGLQWVH